MWKKNKQNMACNVQRIEAYVSHDSLHAYRSEKAYWEINLSVLLYFKTCWSDIRSNLNYHDT